MNGHGFSLSRNLVILRNSSFSLYHRFKKHKEDILYDK